MKAYFNHALTTTQYAHSRESELRSNVGLPLLTEY